MAGPHVKAERVIVPRSNPDYTSDGGGTYEYMSWDRLEQELHHIRARDGVGGLKHDEQLNGLYVTVSGIHFEIGKK